MLVPKLPKLNRNRKKSGLQYMFSYFRFQNQGASVWHTVGIGHLLTSVLVVREFSPLPPTDLQGKVVFVDNHWPSNSLNPLPCHRFVCKIGILASSAYNIKITNEETFVWTPLYFLKVYEKIFLGTPSKWQFMPIYGHVNMSKYGEIFKRPQTLT